MGVAGLHVADQRAHGNADDDLLAVGAGLLLAPALLALLGPVVLLVLEVDERAELLVGLDDDIAALAAVAAARSALRNVGLAAECDNAGPAVAAP